VDVGFVEWDEEEREDLMDLDKEDLGLLVEFVAFNIQHNSGRQNLVPAVYHPDNPSRVDLSEQWKGVVLEAGNSAERVDEAGVGQEVGIEGTFLVCWRAFSEGFDDTRDLFLRMVHLESW